MLGPRGIGSRFFKELTVAENGRRAYFRLRQVSPKGVQSKQALLGGKGVFMEESLFDAMTLTRPEVRTSGSETVRTELRGRASRKAPVEPPRNASLESHIGEVIQRLTAGRIRDLRVEVRGGDVRLFGRCNTFYSKQLAQHAAMGLTGCSTLTNEIEVS